MGKLFKYVNKSEFIKIPHKTGVYLFKDKSRKILYIGKATNLKERAKNHFQQPSFQDNLFIKKVVKIGYIKTNSEIEALILEANLIKKHQPKFNIIWRDDKNYFFVGITRENFPCIFITHQIKLKTINYKLETDFVGPFVDGKALKETLKILRKIFPFRSCNIIPKRPCLWYQLSRCPSPCLLKSNLGSQLPSAKIKIKNECQKNAKNIMKIIQRGKSQVINNLKREMKVAAKTQNFEKAAKIRDKIHALEKIISHAKIFESQEIILPEENWDKTQKILKNLLGIKGKISRIEAYDISNIQGQQATGSMVVFVGGKPNKSQYRKFKIRFDGKSRTRAKPHTVRDGAKLGAGLTPYRSAAGGTGTGPNDTAMIKEILTRRFNHPEWPFPDIILIDGGKTQLNAALNIANQHKSAEPASIRVMALAKKKNELYTENRKQPTLLKALPREIFNLILKLRDEAHRFAINYHRKLRKRALID